MWYIPSMEAGCSAVRSARPNMERLNIEPLAPAELSAEHRCCWQAIRRDVAVLQNPFFSPDFSRAVASVGRRVQVAVLKEAGEPIGFFPFERGGRTGRPVGSRLSDFQGVVARGPLEWDAAELIRQCNLSAFDFDHLLASQRPFHAYHRDYTGARYMDLSNGFETYVEERRQAGSKRIGKVLNRARKLQREVAPLRFEMHTSQSSLLRLLIGWKSEQYRRTGGVNVLRRRWVRRLLERLLHKPTDDLDVLLSVLWCGDRPSAISYSLRSLGVLHGWFMAYDRQLSVYAPGLILLLETARSAADFGIRRIDLGKGEEEYKISFTSGVTPVSKGSVPCTLIKRLSRGVWWRTRSWLRQPHRHTTRAMAARLTRPIRGWLSLR